MLEELSTKKESVEKEGELQAKVKEGLIKQLQGKIEEQ